MEEFVPLRRAFVFFSILFPRRLRGAPANTPNSA